MGIVVQYDMSANGERCWHDLIFVCYARHQSKMSECENTISHLIPVSPYPVAISTGCNEKFAEPLVAVLEACLGVGSDLRSVWL
jgi:hypothetical protein